MSHRDQLPEPASALERSLRDGPPDEAGYRPEAINYSAAPGEARVERRGGGRTSPAERRSRPTRPLLSLADALVVLLVVVVGSFFVLQRVGQVGTGPGPSASPVPVPALTQTFVSTRNGFSVQYPVGWQTTAATSSWRPGTYVPIGNSALDELKFVGQARLVVASQRLGPGETEAQWLAAFAQPFDLGRCSGDRAGWPRLAVDGELGYLDIEACQLPADTGFSAPDLLFDVIVFSGGRAYEIGLDGVVDRGYFEAILATIHFDPANALDPPAGS